MAVEGRTQPDAGTATPADARRGFATLEVETRIESLPVRGEPPPSLEGSLIRTGPAEWELGDRSMKHWFDGLAMLHRFSFADGEVSYGNRFLETRAYRTAKARGQLSYREFATDPCRSLYQRVTAMFSSDFTDNANVNLVKLGERFIAMTETPLPVLFDRDTLAAAGVAYRAPGQLTTAHPHLDRDTGGILNYAAKLGPRSSYRFFLLRPDSSSPEVIGSISVREPAYMHSFGLTPRWLVLAEFPLVVNPLELALSGRPYIENYRWKPELGTRFHLVDRTSGRVIGPFETNAMLRLPPRQLIRGCGRGRRRPLQVRGRHHRPGPVSGATAGRQADLRSPARALPDLPGGRHRHQRTAPGGTARASADQLRALQRTPLPLCLGCRASIRLA